MVKRDPRLVVSFGTTGDGRAISTGHTDLVGWIHSLRLSRVCLCSFSALTTTFLLGEQSGDPSTVNEEGSAAKDSSDDEVEEYAE